MESHTLIVIVDSRNIVFGVPALRSAGWTKGHCEGECIKSGFDTDTNSTVHAIATTLVSSIIFKLLVPIC